MCEDSISKLKELTKGDFPAARVLRDPRNLEIKEYISHGMPVSRLAVKSGLAAELLAPYFGGKLLICGIGNQEETPVSGRVA